MPRTLCSLLTIGLALSVPLAAEDLLVADYEGKDYGDWVATGTAFGPGPARGTLPNQMAVDGYRGSGLVNTFFGGDDATGTLTSPSFEIRRKRINFLIGGGRHPGECALNLLVDGKAVREATGADSEFLRPGSWDVAELAGKTARLEIVDRRKGGWGHISVDQIVQSDEPAGAVDDREGLLARAEASVKSAAARAEADPARPIFHLLPAANWTNDPNGPLYHRGAYHIFHQFNPYGDDWGNMHWGHYRSRDLVTWERLPIALWPSKALGEDHVFSGCAARARDGSLLLLYTSIGGRLPEQWGAVPEDDELIRWKKHPKNPLLTEKLHGEVKVDEWRDPFFFQDSGRDYLVCGGNLNASRGGEAVVNVYRAEDPGLTSWKYLGLLFRHPDREVKNIECPLFFRIDDTWVLVVSQGKPVQYFTGGLEREGNGDQEHLKFIARHRGVMDHGQYYAPNCFEDPQSQPPGRRLLWGWMDGVPGGRGWRHSFTLPRVLSVGPGGEILQEPAPELAALRGEHRRAEGIALASASRVIDGVKGDTLEIDATVEPGDAKSCGIRLRSGGKDPKESTVALSGEAISAGGFRVPFRPAAGEKSLRLRIFVDRSILEVYAGGRECLSAWIPALGPEASVEIFAEGGSATASAVDVWTVKSIWR